MDNITTVGEAIQYIESIKDNIWYIVLARNKQYSFKSIHYGIITPNNSIEDSDHPFLVFIVKNDYVIVI